MTLRPFALFVCLLAACSASSDPISDGTTGPGEDGEVTVTYIPLKPIGIGENLFDVEILDRDDGTPITGATLTIDLAGPSGEARSVATRERTAGSWHTDTFWIPTSGRWIMTFHVEKSADHLHDHVTFRLQVP